MANGLNGKSKWALVPIGICAVLVAAAAGYGKLQGHVDARLQSMSSQVADITVILPEIRDRLTAIETDVKWIKRGMNDE